MSLTLPHLITKFRILSVMKGLRNQNVLITGATSGIGQAIAVRFAQEGMNLALNYRRGLESLDETRHLIEEKVGSNPEIKIIPVKADISQENQVIQMIDQTIQKLGDLDILVNNAGIQFEEESHEVEADDFDQVINVNLRGAYLCAREAIEHFLKPDQTGIILNVSSVHEIIPRPKYLSYSISKGGMENMTKTLALEYARQNIRVNAIAPGATATSINDWSTDSEKMQKVADFVPMGRVGNPEEMAAVAAFLVSDDASYITGQTLFIDGGLTLYPAFAQSGVT